MSQKQRDGMKLKLHVTKYYMHFLPLISLSELRIFNNISLNMFMTWFTPLMSK